MTDIKKPDRPTPIRDNITALHKLYSELEDNNESLAKSVNSASELIRKKNNEIVDLKAVLMKATNENTKLKKDMFNYVKDNIDARSLLPKVQTISGTILDSLNKIKGMWAKDTTKERTGLTYHKSRYTAIYCLSEIKDTLKEVDTILKNIDSKTEN